MRQIVSAALIFLPSGQDESRHSYRPIHRGLYLHPFKKRNAPMAQITNSLRFFLTQEDGPTAVEYAVMLALIIVVCLTAVQSIGTRANATFQSVAAKLPAGGAS
jgi:pilus assembly protein Flp/PilA